MENLIKLRSVNEELAEFFKMIVKSKYNIFISGATNCGKTTFLNILSGFIPKEERIITIEDSIELDLKETDNLVTLEARSGNVSADIEISIRDLIKTSLRMRPDRIIVGEVRGSECIDMLMAMNTGHDGSMSTGHGNSPQEMLLRLETMYLYGMDIPLLAIRNQLASSLDIMIHIGRLRDNSRKIMSVCEVMGVKNGEVVLNKLFEFVEEGEDENGKILGRFVKRSELIHREKLRRAGFG
jgi:pilus assembly protein CpaF